MTTFPKLLCSQSVKKKICKYKTFFPNFTKFSSGQVECTFGNPVKTFLLEVRKSFKLWNVFHKISSFKTNIICSFDFVEYKNSISSVSTWINSMMNVSVDKPHVSRRTQRKTGQFFASESWHTENIKTALDN